MKRQESYTGVTQMLYVGPKPNSGGHLRFLLPIIGNLLDLPRGSSPWLAYSEISKTYGVLSSRRPSDPKGSRAGPGNLVYLEVMGHPMLIINDVCIAVDLLEKRSNIHSSRPVSNVISL